MARARSAQCGEGSTNGGRWHESAAGAPARHPVSLWHHSGRQYGAVNNAPRRYGERSRIFGGRQCVRNRQRIHIARREVNLGLQPEGRGRGQSGGDGAGGAGRARRDGRRNLSPRAEVSVVAGVELQKNGDLERHRTVRHDGQQQSPLVVLCTLQEARGVCSDGHDLRLVLRVAKRACERLHLQPLRHRRAVERPSCTTNGGPAHGKRQRPCARFWLLEGQYDFRHLEGGDANTHAHARRGASNHERGRQIIVELRWEWVPVVGRVARAQRRGERHESRRDVRVRAAGLGAAVGSIGMTRGQWLNVAHETSRRHRSRWRGTPGRHHGTQPTNARHDVGGSVTHRCPRQYERWLCSVADLKCEDGHIQYSVEQPDVDPRIQRRVASGDGGVTHAERTTMLADAVERRAERRATSCSAPMKCCIDELKGRCRPIVGEAAAARRLSHTLIDD
eukprot:7380237-Prymnesium_polylepis.1